LTVNQQAREPVDTMAMGQLPPTGWFAPSCSICKFFLCYCTFLLLPGDSSPFVSYPGWGSLRPRPGRPTNLALSVPSHCFGSWTDALWSVVPTFLL